MKIRRFTGADMRDALRQVRNALGADAVILETAHNASGVEISAASGYRPAVRSKRHQPRTDHQPAAA